MIIFFTTILCLPLMLIVAGLGIDLAALATLRDKVQVAADAGAVAGASAIHFVKDDEKCEVNCPGQVDAEPRHPQSLCGPERLPRCPHRLQSRGAECHPSRSAHPWIRVCSG